MKTGKDGLVLAVSLAGICVLSAAVSAGAAWSTDSSVNTPVVTAEEPQGCHRIVHDGKGGWFIAWHDQRDEGTTNWDIYAQYFDCNGTHQLS